MELLKEIAKDKLVIMVTHNPDLAEEYSTRIIKLLDGKVVNDSNPLTKKEEELESKKDSEVKTNKTHMSFITALSLSLNNLMTKKGRTILTAFAGSIGIIGIALIMSLSNGVQEYIKRVEEELILVTKFVDKNKSVSSLMTNKENILKEITKLTNEIKNKYPDFKKTYTYPKLEKIIKKTDAKYLLKYEDCSQNHL